MTRLRFLLDEHVDWAIQRGLLRFAAEIDVLAVGQPLAPPKGTPDPDILRWIEQTGYVLVTQNRRTISEHWTAHYAAGGQAPGVFWLRPGAGIGAVIQDLYLLWATTTAEECQNWLLYLPLE
ncbi:MAG: DUF5615 family PIN-like protein [Chloroflexi bacterium]|nr:DUF5615 family PIN-like protein [Chloroflexota bacterium]